jgi:hypothetical protein
MREQRLNQFDKRLESFAPSFSQSLLLYRQILQKPDSILVLKIHTKKSAEQENWSLFMNGKFIERKNEGRKLDKNSSLMPRNLDKEMPFKNSISV